MLFSGAGAELLDQFYGDGLYTSHWLAAIGAAVQEAARHLPEGRGLRILEIGGGTAGLAAQVLPLLERGLHTYTFTDVSAGFFPGALQKLAAFPEVECKIFDLEKPGTDQDLRAAESFDFIIGTNVLHAVSDVRATLGHLHDLLAPGGSLVFMDMATPQLWTETVFGLTSGWWRFTDRDLRPDQPLLERAQWEARVDRKQVLAKSTSLPGLIGPRVVKARSACSRERPGSNLRSPPAGGNARGKIVAHFRRRLRAGRATGDRNCAPPERIAGSRGPASNLPRPEPTLSPCARKRRRIGRNFSQPARPQHPSSESSTSGGSTHPRKSRIRLHGHRRFAAPQPGARSDQSRRQSCGSMLVTRGAQPVGREMAATDGGSGSRRSGCSGSSSTNTRTSPAAGSICRRWLPTSDAALLWSELLAQRRRARNRPPWRSPLRPAPHARTSVRRAVARSGGAAAPRVPRARPPRHAALRAVRAAPLRTG